MPNPFLSQIVPTRLNGPQLFVDWRLVDPGMIEWRDNGEKLSVMTAEMPEAPRAFPVGIPRGIHLRAEDATLKGPIFELDRPWETNYNMYFATAMKHEGVFKIWYTCVPPDNKGEKWERGQVVCYAESTDGISWIKPDLGLFSYEGMATNVVFGRELAPYGFQSGSIFLDPAAEPSERFKLIYVANLPVDDMAAFRKRMNEHFEGEVDPRSFVEGRPNHHTPGLSVGTFRSDAKVICGAASPDGIHWSARKEPISALFSDTLNSASWDEERQEYVAYVRTWRYGRRCVGRMTTTNFWHWPRLPDTVLEAGLNWNPADDIYTNSKILVPGTTNTHMMFPGTFHRDTNSRDITMASSVDDLTWLWISCKPVVKRGRPGSWSAGDLNPGIGLLRLQDGSLALPVMAYEQPHKFPRGGSALGRLAFAHWEENRLACIAAPAVGEFQTPPLVFEGRSLTLNHCTDPTGEIRVQVADEHGSPLPGFSFDDAIPCAGDHTRDIVRWKEMKTLESVAGQRVRLMFSLRAAKLYALEIEP